MKIEKKKDYSFSLLPHSLLAPPPLALIPGFYMIDGGLWYSAKGSEPLTQCDVVPAYFRTCLWPGSLIYLALANLAFWNILAHSVLLTTTYT